jgi:hypothetical protein
MCKYEWLLTTDEKTNSKKVEENRQCPRSIVNWPVTIKTSQIKELSGAKQEI